MEIEHIFCDGVYSKVCTFKRGESDVQHKHNFSHLSIVASGFFCVTAEGEDSREYGPGAVIVIPAGVAHGVLARTGGVWVCTHRSDIVDTDLIDESLIQPEAPQHATHPED